MSITSYAQNFEDVMLWRALSHIEHGFYIDVGAQDPIIDSVSLVFYERGWHGIHVEPLPHYADLLRQQRPGDTVIQAAVGNGPAVLCFFEIAGTGISTADASIAAQHRERGFDIRDITVPCITLSSIFDAGAEPEIHWLKIDVEGFEEHVLASWGSSQARPWIVVVESTLPLTQIETHEKWESILIAQGYDPVYFDGLNRYYVSEAHQELKAAFLTPPNVFDGFALNGTSSSSFHKLIETRYQEKISVARSQADLQKHSADNEIERLRGSIATFERTISEREQEFGARLLAVQKQSAEEGTERDREHSEQVQTLQHQHTEKFNQAKQDLETLLRTLAQREQELGAQLLAIQEQATKDAAEQARLHAEREHVLGQQLHSAHQEFRRLAQDLENRERAHVVQNSLSQQALNDLLRTQVQRETDIASLLMRTQQQAHKEIAVQASNHQQQLDALQRGLAEREQTLNLQLKTREQELREKALVSDAAQKRYVELLQAERATSEARQAALNVLQNELAKIQTSLLFRLSAPFRAIASHGSQAVTRKIEHRLKHPQVALPSSALADADISPANESATEHHVSKSITATNDQSLRAAMPIPLNKYPDLESLLQYQDRKFVEHAYLALLNRQPDPTGFAFYVDRLRAGVPKIQILGEIFASAEAKRIGKHISGLREAMRRQALRRLPVVGPLMKIFVKVGSHSTLEIQLRVIEQRAYLLSQQAELQVAQLELVIKRLQELIKKGTLANPPVVFTNSPATTLDAIEASAAAIAPPSIFSKPIVFEPAPSNEVIQQLAKALAASQEARQLSDR
jgi:FkbM family methyltransferase